ncbi:hypothetical protein BC940DRAFT_329338 [Gongronella butleri]|nr:hypothetical protein BC940DRAFT_329338 [Gongronella butleri]
MAENPNLPPLPAASNAIRYLMVNLQHLERLDVHTQRYALSAYLERHPQEPRLWALRALLERHNNHPAVAIAIVDQGLRHVPDEPYLTALLGQLQQDQAHQQ